MLKITVFLMEMVLASALGSLVCGSLNAEVDSAGFFLSEGERYFDDSRGFSIVPPIGWEVHTEYPNLSLLLQVPYSKGLDYQRTIQIMSFKGWRHIDEAEIKEFEKIIVERYSEMTSTLKNFRVRNSMITKMEDGREGILYYTEFDLQDKLLHF